MKALLKACHIAGALNHISRASAIPRLNRVPFVHLVLSGLAGRQFLNAVNPAAQGIYVFGHPTLGTHDRLHAPLRRPDGGPGHTFGYHEFPEPMEPEEFAALSIIELYIPGALERYRNGWDRQGEECVAIVGAGLGPLASVIRPGAIAWKTGNSWAAVDGRYKRNGGASVIEADERGSVVVRTIDLASHENDNE